MPRAATAESAASTAPESVAKPSAMTGKTAVVPVLVALSICHLMNDLMQSMIPALYPMLKDHFQLDFGQIGMITLAFQLTASLLQPTVGMYTDRKPQPYSLAVGMGATSKLLRRPCATTRALRPAQS